MYRYAIFDLACSGVMETGTEIADRPLRVPSGNSAREGFTFVFIHRSLHPCSLIAFI